MTGKERAAILREAIDEAASNWKEGKFLCGTELKELECVLLAAIAERLLYLVKATNALTDEEGEK